MVMCTAKDGESSCFQIVSLSRPEFALRAAHNSFARRSSLSDYPSVQELPYE